MINRLICSYILFSCLVAVALKLGGVEETIHLGNYFRAYLVQSNKELLNFKIAIPTIKSISMITDDGSRYIDSGSLGIDVLYYLGANVKILNGIAQVLNGIANFFNIIITIINTLIQTIQLIFIFLKNIVVMKDNIIAV